MQNRTEGETYRVVVWSIDNFSCWNNEIHEKVIISPESQTIPTINVKLYPRGLNGNDEHLVVLLACSSPRSFLGEVSFIGSDGSVLCTQQVDSKEKKSVLELPPGPKFEEVITQIRKNEDLYRDRIILRYQIRSVCDNIEYMHTTIYALEVSLKIYPEIFSSLQSIQNTISLLEFPLHETEIKPIMLEASKDQIDHSKMVLTLYPVSYEKKASVFTCMSILSNEDVVRTEENEHLFRDDSKWIFSNTLTREDVATEGFFLILHFKVIPSSNYKHSFGLYSYYPLEIDIVKLNRIKSPETITSKEQSSKSLSTVTSHKPGNSLIVLSSELMCVYQDQDFSDFQLKCGDVSFPVHRVILSARSPVFKTMLSTDMREAASGTLDVVDLDPSTLCLFLTYLYTGAVEEELQCDRALNLYYAADKYQVPSLKSECADFLISNISISNVCDILSLSNKHQDDELIKMSKDFFLNNFNEVLASEEWKKFMKKEPLLALETVTDFGEKKFVGKIGSA